MRKDLEAQRQRVRKLRCKHTDNSTDTKSSDLGVKPEAVKQKTKSKSERTVSKTVLQPCTR